ncbi:NACHT domain-containing NTPase [Rhizobium leguminosarum]|uniref:NACHT domain-containing protein n=1 Tax=Rhizobium leguminosarum TaxID=384 RepID=UPI003F9CBAF7
MLDWAKLEDDVRTIAQTHWNAPCKPRTIHGVRCDGVIEVKSDYWIAIEISKSDSLEKLRTDVAKFASIRMAQMAKGIYTECMFITAGDTSSLKDTGRSNNVDVMSIAEFAGKFIGKDEYVFIRNNQKFGSAVDPDTGSKDNASFAEVQYISNKHGNAVDIKDIVGQLTNRKKMILIGEFGSGKSRCVQEVFLALSKADDMFPTIAINLRDCWGLQSFDLILRSHLESLGLSKMADNLIKLAAAGKVRFLLDGFDEIGSQSWTGEIERLKDLRRRSLKGVFDLIEKCGNGGVLITGRQHYFSSNREMLDCLGLKFAQVEIVECRDEFSESELQHYLASNSILVNVPSWMPRKPLICQLFSKLPSAELSSISDNAIDEVDFFEKFLDAICARERRIHASIDDKVLKAVLLRLSDKSREKITFPEQITPEEINKAFFEVSGLTPLDESAIMLQRLPYLGRTGTDNANRIFIDDYAKSGLRGLSLCGHIYLADKTISSSIWKGALGEFGARVVWSRVTNWAEAHKYGAYCAKYGNSQVGADIVVSQLSGDDTVIDFAGVRVENAQFDVLDFSGSKIINLKISSSAANEIRLDEATFERCSFQDMIGNRAAGVGSGVRLPECFEKCDFTSYDQADNTARISELPLTDAQKTLLSLIKKLFFQRGRGRKEEGLLRGAEDYWDKRTAASFIRYALGNGIVLEARGDEGKIYVPQRRHMRRMANIMERMGGCGDAIWALAG